MYPISTNGNTIPHSCRRQSPGGILIVTLAPDPECPLPCPVYLLQKNKCNHHVISSSSSSTTTWNLIMTPCCSQHESRAFLGVLGDPYCSNIPKPRDPEKALCLRSSSHLLPLSCVLLVLQATPQPSPISAYIIHPPSILANIHLSF